MLETTARRDGSEWVLNGRKRWIGNAVWCDVIVVFARDTQDGQVKAFVVEKDNPGYAASKIMGKVSLRIVQNADITLTDCRVSEDARLQNCTSFAGAPGCSRAPATRFPGHRPDMGSPPTTSP
jgi:glutaryl-CoA dehydrogenase